MTRLLCAVALACACLLAPVPALAQPEAIEPPGHSPPPESLPPGHPPVTPTQASGMPPGHPSMDEATARERVGQALRPPEVASARPSTAVPRGSIQVRVVDRQRRPIPGAEVAIGVMAQAGDRERLTQTTGPTGMTVFAGLPTGGAQAYRVNVPYEGATYSSTPFQLPTDRGYEVEVTRLPVTHEPTGVFFHLFRVVVEQGTERIHVIHQTQLTNAGTETYVFPAGGLRVALPEGALAFQTQAVMTDQRIEEVRDEDAYRIRGSLPPGTVQLAYAYDLELDGTELDVPVALPLPIYALQAIAEAIPGLTLDVAGLPPPQRLDPDGRPCIDSEQTPGCAWVTQLRRAPTDPAIRSMTMHVGGIPGPGNLRWWALGIAVAFLLGGGFLFATGGSVRAGADASRARRRRELVEEARRLDDELESGEISPQFRQKRRAAIVRELAALLHEADAAKKQAHPPR